MFAETATPFRVAFVGTIVTSILIIPLVLVSFPSLNPFGPSLFIAALIFSFSLHLFLSWTFLLSLIVPLGRQIPVTTTSSSRDHCV